MQINVSRNKILIRTVPNLRTNNKRSSAQRCNHCGGTFKNGPDMKVCIMCSRESGHTCSNCTHTPADKS